MFPATSTSRQSSISHSWLPLLLLASLSGSACVLEDEPSDAPPLPIGVGEQALEGGMAFTPTGIWESIGRLFIGGGRCTATLISEYAVLTAAHCLADFGLGTGDQATFVLPNGRGSIVGTATLHPQYNIIKWAAYDYAVVQFPQSIFDDPSVDASGLTPIPVSREALDAGDEGYMFGYGNFGADCSMGADGNLRVSWQTLDSVSEDWHYHHLDSAVGLCGGDSGGPFVASVDGSWQVAAVNSWGNGDNSYMKPTYMVSDWIMQQAGAPDLPGDTWGHCVYYKTDVSGQFLSTRENQPSMSAWGFDQSITLVWVRKGYRATLFDYANYGGWSTSFDGFTGDNCDDSGCLYDLTGTGYDNDASSARCESALPGDTWGHCVYYGPFDSNWMSVQGNFSFSGSYAAYDNWTSQIWVKRGHTARAYPNLGFQGSPYWSSRVYDGYNGDWCNGHGCLHDLVGTVAERTASSIVCD